MEAVFCQGMYGDVDELVDDPGAWCSPGIIDLPYRHQHLNNKNNDDEWCLMDGEDEEDNVVESSNSIEILSRRNDDRSMRVMTQAMMESLQPHLPLAKRGESFWLQYSLVRDGASIETMLDKCRGTDCSVLAVETVGGEVFGAFCAQAWKLSTDYDGSGESFLWRLPNLRSSSFGSTPEEEDEAELVDLDVYNFAFTNRNIQLCQHERLLIGGGNKKNEPHWGFGLALDQDLLQGSSSPCLTFQSPSLSAQHADGSIFEVRNLEVWALTPSISLEEAERNQQNRRLLSGAFFKRAFSYRRRKK